MYMTEQIDTSSQIGGALSAFFNKAPERGNTGNLLGPIRVARATAKLGEAVTNVEAVVMSDNGPDAYISTTTEAAGCAYYNCSAGRWTTGGEAISVERAAELCAVLSAAAIK